MTSSFAQRPNLDAANGTAGLGDLCRSDGRPPAGAITLAELISDSGPLPADAALECVQRLAERLSSSPDVHHDRLGPSDVLIDDDGGVWLSEPAGDGPPTGAGDPAEGMDRIGRLLSYLATGDRGHLDRGATVNAGELPPPLATVAGRLFSRNGTCYQSYADLAREAAELRGVRPAIAAATRDAETVESSDPSAEPRPAATEVRTASVEPAAVGTNAVEWESSGAKLALAATIVVAIAAALAYAAVQWL